MDDQRPTGKRGLRLRFSILDLLLFTTIVALVIAWSFDHLRLKEDIARQDQFIAMQDKIEDHYRSVIDGLTSMKKERDSEYWSLVEERKTLKSENARLKEQLDTRSAK